MSSSVSDEKKLQTLLSLLKKEKTLTEVAENEILSYFESRGEKAVDVLKEQKLSKLILDEKFNLWEVEGKSKNYLIIEDNFCECTDFQIRVLRKGKKTMCYHLLAKTIGEKLNIFNIKNLSAEEYNTLIENRIKNIK